MYSILLLCFIFLCSFTRIKKYELNEINGNNNGSTFLINNYSLNKNDIKQVLIKTNVNEKIVESYEDEFIVDLTNAKKIYVTNATSSQPNFISLSKPVEIIYSGLDGTKKPIEEYESELTDEYMQITYIVADYGNQEFKFSIDAVWLKMPFFRMWDSLGATCMNMTVINSSRYGYYDYEINNSGENIRKNFTTDDMHEAVNGNWYGSACTFQIKGVSPYDTYTNFKVHYEYNGHFNGSNDNPYINTTATYCHQRLGINISPSIVISTSDKPSIGFEATLASNYEYRVVDFPYDIKVTI